MSQIDTLQKLLSDMETQLNKLDEYIKLKEETIEYTSQRIEELNRNLLVEQESLSNALKRKVKMTDMQNEVLTNYNQINESVNTLVEILRTKDVN
jgi:hypothetical protein